MHNWDSWDNVLTNLGSRKKSRSGYTNFTGDGRLDQQTLTNIYSSDGLGRRIVNVLVDDALRNFIEANEKLLKEFARLKVKQKIIDACTWARLFGGALMVAFVDDGLDLHKKLTPERIKKVVSIKVYDRHQVSWEITDLSTDFYDENFGEPEYFTITKPDGVPFKVHKSRCFRFEGERIPDYERTRNNGWGASIIQPVYEAIRNYGTSMNSASEIVQDFIQTIISVDGLADMLRQGNDDLITKRVTILDLSRSVSNTVLLDAENEEYSKHASSVTGLPELLDRFVEAISGATGIPITKLTGRAPAGLNATGEHDSHNWNGIVDAYRKDEIEPAINWIIDMVKEQSIWTVDKPTDFEWSWPALKTPCDEEWARIKLLTAQSDEIYVRNGVIDPITLGMARFEGGGWNTDITIDKKAFLEFEREQEKAEEQMMKMEMLQKTQVPKSPQLANNSKFDAEDKLLDVKTKIYEKILGQFDGQ